MRLDILSRSGREVVKGGVELQDDVCSPFFMGFRLK